MSLSSALSIAQNSLLNTQRQISVVSRNISDANNPHYARRSVHLSTTAPGAQIAEVRRATNEALFRQNLSAVSGYSAQHTMMEGLDRLSTTVNGVENKGSAAKALSDFKQALQFYSGNASSGTLAATTVESARHLVRTLNEGTRTIQQFRDDMDGQIAEGVADLNRLLSDFHKVNQEVLIGTRAGREVNDSLDARDKILTQISELLPVSTIRRADNDLMIVSANGTTLFETIPREVTFTRTSGFDAMTAGDGIRVDGVPISAGIGGNTTASGSLAAKLQLRDSVAQDMQLQLDEVTRALNDAIPGLVTFTGNLADPGIAGRVRLNPAIDPSGNPPGNALLLRDGILTNQNPDGHAGFSDLLMSYLDNLDAPRSFTTAGGATATLSIGDYATDALSWLEASRKDAATGSDTKSALLMRTSSALSHSVNVNIDEEMVLLLQLETSYGASARILQTIDKLLATLLDVAR